MTKEELIDEAKIVMQIFGWSSCCFVICKIAYVDGKVSTATGRVLLNDLGKMMTKKYYVDQPYTSLSSGLSTMFIFRDETSVKYHIGFFDGINRQTTGLKIEIEELVFVENQAPKKSLEENKRAIKSITNDEERTDTILE